MIGQRQDYDLRASLIMELEEIDTSRFSLQFMLANICKHTYKEKQIYRLNIISYKKKIMPATRSNVKYDFYVSLFFFNTRHIPIYTK